MREGLELSDRVRALHDEVRRTPPTLCAERALLLTRFFKREAKWRPPMTLTKARALEYILRHKTVRIFPNELLVGNFTAHRVGGGLFPEAHGVPMLEDLFRFSSRSLNPLRVSRSHRRRLLLEVVPFWIRRAAPLRALPLAQQLRFAAEQLEPTFYLVNEVSGISHFIPHYQGLIAHGTRGYREQAVTRLAREKPDSPEAMFCEAVVVACAALDAFAERYHREASALAAHEPEPTRRAELEHIAAICGRVPREPARSLHEALQSILLAQIALNIEAVDNSVSLGRLDQILFPFYEHDLAAGALNRDQALELLGCFAVKLCELVPAFSRRATRFHGGMFNGQVVVVGGTDRHGLDATNDLTYLFLELMDELRTRQPNYHARLHRGSPATYRLRIAQALARGAVSPAVYNDEVVVPLLESRGIARADALDYANVGCVEPVCPGKSFLSTDAALFNLAACLELALNRGRRFGQWRRAGVATPAAENCSSMNGLIELFRIQLQSAVCRLLRDLQAVERANAKWNPTPLSSMLVQGCIDTARDASAGGAIYNGSGIQGLGVIEVGDSLAALDGVVFRDRKATLAEVIQACRANFRGFEALRSRLLNFPKYGNDDPLPDGYVGRVMEMFSSSLAATRNTRGGEYVAGFYSVTSHVAFGKRVGAMPSGRLASQPFSSGISPSSGMDRLGPTAALRSAASLPLQIAKNGVNFNLQLAPWLVAGSEGARTLQALIDGGFAAGCMQAQVNVLDPKILIDARDNPGRYPGLLVRVSGYSAYFDDLSPEMKQEIIERTLHDGPKPEATQGEPQGG